MDRDAAKHSPTPRADVTHSLNTLTHFGEQMTIVYDDPDNRDKFFRFQESIQEFFNLAHSLELDFPFSDPSNTTRVQPHSLS